MYDKMSKAELRALATAAVAQFRDSGKSVTISPAHRALGRLISDGKQIRR